MLVGPTACLGEENLVNCFNLNRKTYKNTWNRLGGGGARPRLGKVCRLGQGEVGGTHSDMVKEIWIDHVAYAM